jgi:hypothetical protein
MELWGVEQIDRLVDRLGEVMPEEDLTADEVLTACYDQPGVVFALDGGVVAAGVGRAFDGAMVASLRLLVASPGTSVHPLLEHAESWARDRDATRLEVGGALPFALWPGVALDSAHLEALGARGYVDQGGFSAHGVPTSFRSDPPEGVDVRRAVRDEDVVAVMIAASRLWPWWSDEVARSLEHGTCHVATTITADSGEQVIGIGCHSVTRATWVGPIGVVDTHRRRGVGHALLGQICRDLMIADFPRAEAPEVAPGPIEGFLTAAGSSPVRQYRRLVLDLR